MNNCFLMMTEHNIQGREILQKLLINNITIEGVLIEKGSKLSKITENYLVDGFYSPPSTYDLLTNTNIPIYFTDNHNNKANVLLCQKNKVKLIVLGGTRILSPEVINSCECGILNAHPGIIPQYRGMDVVAWSIYNGDVVGATCHLIAPEIDAGHILLKRELVYSQDDDLLTIRIKNMILCADLMVESVKNFENINPVKVDTSIGKRYFSMPFDIQKKLEEKLCLH